MVTLGLVFAGFFFVGNALAHLQMTDPFPIMSTLNPAVKGGDIDLKSPLAENGSQFPCKGYLELDASFHQPQAAWAAGSSQTFSIDGSATHGGGSCQLSLSYDMGETWNVIMSYIGGCMAESKTLGFDLPSESPSGEAIFSWTWFNHFGKREMYQNCAVITVTNGGSGLNSKDHPALFVANAPLVAPGCEIIEGQDIIFPEPGISVKYSGMYKGTVPTSGRGLIGSNCLAPGGADGAGTAGGVDSGGSEGDQLSQHPSLTASTEYAVGAVPSSTAPAPSSKPCGKAKHPSSPAKSSTSAVPVHPGQSATSVSGSGADEGYSTRTFRAGSVSDTPSNLPSAASARPTRVRKCRRRRSRMTAGTASST